MLFQILHENFRFKTETIREGKTCFHVGVFIVLETRIKKRHNLKQM